MSGTSGGITTNGLWGYGIFDSNSWPIILDLLEDAHVTWKIYNAGGFDDVHGLVLLADHQGQIDG